LEALAAANLYIDKYPLQGPGSRYCFITHWHRDHLVGLDRSVLVSRTTTTWYCTLPTSQLFQRALAVPPEQVVVLEYGQPVAVNGFVVTAYDSNHILGGMMLLFEQEGCHPLFYTGDYRYVPDLVLPSIPIGTLYHDSLFHDPAVRFLTLEESCALAAAWTLRHPVPKFVAYAHLGTCQLLTALHRTWGLTFRLDQQYMTKTDIADLMALYTYWDPASDFTLVHIKNPEPPTPLLVPTCLWHSVGHARFIPTTVCQYRPDLDGLVCRINFTNHSDFQDNLALVQRLTPLAIVELERQRLHGTSANSKTTIPKKKNPPATTKKKKNQPVT
jgi:Cft2 family RNA processing exonuclease